MALLFFGYSVEFVAFFSLNLEGVARSFWFHIHGAMTYFFLLFVSLLLNYVLFLLDDLLEKIKTITSKHTQSSVKKSLLQFEIIHEFAGEVEKTFGPILTFTMVFTIILLISKVAVYYFHCVKIVTNFQFAELQHCVVIQTRFKYKFQYQSFELSNDLANCVCFNDFIAKAVPRNRSKSQFTYIWWKINLQDARLVNHWFLSSRLRQQFLKSRKCSSEEKVTKMYIRNSFLLKIQRSTGFLSFVEWNLLNLDQTIVEDKIVQNIPTEQCIGVGISHCGLLVLFRSSPIWILFIKMLGTTCA